MSDRGAGTAEKKDKQIIMELNVVKLHLKVTAATKIRIEWVRGKHPTNAIILKFYEI
jgi:hypothetical protein